LDHPGSTGEISMTNRASTTEDLRINDERWRKVLNRFESLEAELQELYWEILEFLDKEHEIQIH
jgi:hypothetical protein